MVLEHLFPENWLEKKHRYAFLLAIVYSLVSIIVARFLFPQNMGIVSLVFLSFLLMPYMKKLLLKEERKELKEKRFTFRRFWFDNKQAIMVYFTLFLGIYVTYLAWSFLISYFGGDVGSVFREQIALDTNVRGAAFSTGTFLSIFLNNWWVLLACFVLALIAGDGALFFIAWNASSWGTIFGYRAVEAALTGAAYGPWANLSIIVLITLPHVLIEAGAYILAAISGGVLSDDIISKRAAMDKFIFYFMSAIVAALVAVFLDRALFGYVAMTELGERVVPGAIAAAPLIGSLLNILIILMIIYSIGFVFEKKKHMEVFHYNYYLFILALLVFLVGAVVETFVLGNSGLLQTVYNALGPW